MNKICNLFKFIKSSPSAYHTVSAVASRLREEGYTEISERDSAAFRDGARYFVIRNGSSIVAFAGRAEKCFMITASHGDFPAFKVKEGLDGTYARLSTERYGGMIYYSWLDRPLSIAGRVVVRSAEGMSVRLVNIDRDLLTIPSVAIHQNRGVNDGYAFNPAVDLLPLYSVAGAKLDLLDMLARELSVAREDIISHDLFLYNREEPRLLEGGLILSPRLDDLACVGACLEAFVAAEPADGAVKVLAVFDNEEVGSSTKQGANSTLLDMTLRRIAGDDEKYCAMLADSYMVSADNAQAKHPNHPELSDGQLAPLLGGGVSVKYNANQSYATDAVSDAIFRTAADRVGAPVQKYATRADKPSGSTLGSIANTKVSVSTVDIGLPQLAMHSASESAAESDYLGLVEILSEIYSSALHRDNEKVILEK